MIWHDWMSVNGWVERENWLSWRAGLNGLGMDGTTDGCIGTGFTHGLSMYVNLYLGGGQNKELSFTCKATLSRMSSVIWQVGRLINHGTFSVTCARLK